MAGSTSFYCEAVEVSGAAGCDKFGCRTARAHVVRIPRGIAATTAIGMTEHRLVIVAVGRPIVAGCVKAGGKGTAFRIRTRQDVVLVWRIPKAFDGVALLC